MTCKSVYCELQCAINSRKGLSDGALLPATVHDEGRHFVLVAEAKPSLFRSPLREGQQQTFFLALDGQVTVLYRTGRFVYAYIIFDIRENLGSTLYFSNL